MAVDAQPSPDSANPALQPLRLMVKFREPVAGSQKAFLKDLAERFGATAADVSSVSADTHVYLIQLPPHQNPEAAIPSLSALPSVMWIERDAILKRK